MLKTFLEKNKNKTIKVNSIPSKIEYIKSKIDNKFNYYTIHSIEKGISDDYYPYFYKIDFKDALTWKPSYSSVYISLITKSKEYSGTKVMNIVLDFLKQFKEIKEITITDGAEVNCDKYKIDLSLYKLLTTNSTFYGKFGFKLVTSNRNIIVDEKMIKLSKKLKNYKIEKIINELEKITENTKKIQNIKFVGYNFTERKVKDKDISDYVKIIKKIIKILHKYKNNKLGNTLELLQNKNCKELSFLLKNICNLPYKFNSIHSKFLEDFLTLNYLRWNYNWNGMYHITL